MKKLFITTILGVLVFFSLSVPTLAIGTGAVCTTVQGAGSTPYCSSQTTGDNPIAGPNGIINKAIDILSIVAGIASVIIIIVAGIQFALSSGDSQRVSKARTAVIYALVGIMVIIAGQSIIKLVLDKL
jgi:type IV secretion system pilin